MANTPPNTPQRIYTIEDSETGQTYNIEGPEDASEEELYSFLESQLSSQSATPQPRRGSVAIEPGTTTMPNTPAPAAAPVASNTTHTGGEFGMDTWGEDERANPLTDEEAQTYLEMTQNLDVPSSEIAAWLQERGAVWTSGSEAELRAYRDAIAAGQPVGTEIGYQSIVNELMGQYLPEYDFEDTSSDFGLSFEEGQQYNPLQAVVSWGEDIADSNTPRRRQFGALSKEEISALYPDLSESELETVHDAVIGEARRRDISRTSEQINRRNIGLVTRLAGNFAGGTSPVDIIPLARLNTFGRRAIQAAAYNTAADAVVQGTDIAYGAQDEWRPEQSAMAAGAGVAFQGVVEGGVRALGAGARVIGRAAGLPDSPNGARIGDAPDSPEPQPIRVPEADRGTSAYRRQREQTTEDIVGEIQTITKDWKNPPNVEVHNSFARIRGVPNDAVGFVDADGTVHISTEGVLREAQARGVSPEDITRAVTFHEGLGHYGLTQRFGDDLDATIRTFYEEGNEAFRNRVDRWMEENPTAYSDLPELQRRIRASEEILAEWSEKGQLPRTFIDKITNLVKEYARLTGVNLKYSEREIRSILAQAHGAVVNGRRTDARSTGFRFSNPRDSRYIQRIDRERRSAIRRANEENEAWTMIRAGEDPAAAGLPDPRQNNRTLEEFNRDNPDPAPSGLPERRLMRSSANRGPDNRGPEVTDEDLFEIQSAQQILTQLEEGYEPTVRSWDEAKAMARARGLTARQYRNVRGVGELDKRLFQYDAIAMRLNDKLTRLHAKMEDGSFTIADKAEYLKTLFRFNEVTAKIFNDQAEIGRALNAMKTLDFTRRRVGELNTILSEYSSRGDTIGAFADDAVFRQFTDQMKFLLSSGNVAGAAASARQILKPYWWQYILTFRHASMLSGLGTHAKNTYDSALMVMRELEESVIASVGGGPVRAGLRAAGKSNVQAGVSPQEVVNRTYGLIRAMFDANTYMSTLKAFREGHGSTPYSSTIEMQDARIPIVSKVNDLLFAMDTFWRAFHSNANMYALGTRQAIADGFTGLRALEEGAARGYAPDKSLIDAAQARADESLLVDSPSALSSWVEMVKTIKPNMKPSQQAVAFTANILFPFLRVSDRLVFQALRRSPLFFLDKNTRADIAAGGAARDIAIGRALYGSALMAFYWYAAGEGDVRGRGSNNYKKNQATESLGIRQNAYLDEENNRWVDATALNLSASPFGVNNAIAANIASIREQWDRDEANAEDTATQLGNAFMNLMTYISSASYAENLSMYIAPVTETDPERRTGPLANFIGGQASAFIPAAVRQYNQQFNDTVRRDTSGDGSLGDRVSGRLMSAIPGLSDNLPARRDFLGDEMPQGRSLSSINNFTEIKEGEVYDELRAIEESTEEPVLTGGPSSFEYEGETISLTAEGQQEWQRLQGYYITQLMREEIASPEWRTYTMEEKQEIVREVRADAYTWAKEDMLPLLGLE